MTIKEGNKLYPGFNWTQHINNMHNSLEVPLTSNEMINVAVPKCRNTLALNNQMTIEEGNKLYPGFNWTQHINNMHNSLEVPMTSNEVINVAAPKYVIKLAEYLTHCTSMGAIQLSSLEIHQEYPFSYG